MTRLLNFILFFILSLVQIESSRILAVFPTPSISHQVVFRRLTDELVRRGHEVTVITTDPLYPAGQAGKNLTEIDVHDISYNLWREELGKVSVGKTGDPYTPILTLLRAMSEIFRSQVAVKEVNDIIKKKNGEFDLLLIEAYFKPALIFSHFFKVPVIHISSIGGLNYNYEVVGASTHPILYPTPLQQKLYNLTKWEKFQQLFQHWWMEHYVMEKIEQEDNKMLKMIFGPDVPSINELSNNVHMLFLNVHPIWTDNQPVPPSVVHIGGIHVTPPKGLPENLQTLLDSSKNGVIYFSLGTNVDPAFLPPEKIQMLIRAFSQLPYDVLWKWNKDVLPGKSQNIKIFKWLPQVDVLSHPNIKLFITQGGLQSTDEAINAGVPLIGIPMLADQWFNVQKYVYHKIGIQLNMESLTENEFKTAIEKVIGDKSYRKNIVRLRALMKDQPQSSIDRAIWWTEHVIRHGGAKHLRAAGANMSWTQYLEIDLIIPILLSLLSVLTVIFICMYKLLTHYLKSEIKVKTS